MIDKEKIKESISKICELTGYELYDWALHGYGKNQKLAVRITHTDGVNIDDCARFSNSLGDELDMRDLFRYPYKLEVSSPGLSRDLTKKRHFAGAVNETVKIRFRNENNHKVSKRGKVLRVDENAVFIEVDDEDEEVKAKFGKIIKAKTIFKIDEN